MENTMNLTGYAMSSSRALDASLRGCTSGFGVQGHVGAPVGPIARPTATPTGDTTDTTDAIDATPGTSAWSPPT